MKKIISEKPRILFIVPPAKTQIGILKPYKFPHIGIGYLMSYLKERDIDVKVVDISFNYNKMEEILINEIKKYDPDIIGLSLYSNVSKQGEDIINVIKKYSKKPIVVGGPHISCTKEEFLVKTGAEYGVVKEGENPLYDLIRVLFISKTKNKSLLLKKLAGVDGLIFKDKDGDFVINENNSLIENLDDIPLPDYASFDFKKYESFRSKNYLMITSRGCPYSCSYCAAPVCTGRIFRTRSADNVVGEIELWSNKGFKNFGIFDDSFNQDMERAKKICELLISKKLGITFDLYNGMRANVVDEELFVLLKKAGCTFISFGMESGNENILKSIGKNLTKKDVSNAIGLANEVGIHTSVNFIIGHPDETYQTALDTLNMAKELKCSYVSIYQLIPIPGTRAYEELKKTANFFYNEDYYLSNITAQSIEPIFETSELSKEQRIKLNKTGRNISKKSILTFRFGKEMGFILYLLLYNDKVFKFVFNFLETDFFLNLYHKIRKV